MDLEKYFEDTKGNGILATADDRGNVDVAIYARPHVMDKETIAFIMADRLTHHNLQSNDKAAYLFMESSPGYKGVRLFLSKIKEETDSELLYSIRRRNYASEEGSEGPSRFLVFLKVDKILPLVGSGPLEK
ncbi:pyridoxamine 5'-phosphate oxidase family protein [Thermodesulfobacteriota bacterium]